MPTHYWIDPTVKVWGLSKHQRQTVIKHNGRRYRVIDRRWDRHHKEWVHILLEL